MFRFQKFVIVTIITLSAFGLFATKTERAHAQVVPVLDAPNLAQNTLLTNKELVLDGILTASAKVIIGNITNSIVTWINSGFQGSPAFVDDPGAFLTDVADQVAGNFIAGSELGFMCQPFALDIRVALAINYSSAYVQRNYCRLSDVVSNTENFAKFTNGDFSQGGWNSFFEISQNPSNNPLGAQLVAQTEMTRRLFNAVGLKEQELNWGEGFLSFRECIASNEETGECAEYGPIQTPGSVIEEQLNSTLGTDLRQLELADEINEIVGALVGQLVKTVFTKGLSSFAPGGSSYGTYGGGTAGPSVPLTVSCSPNATQITAGSSVSWTAYVYGGLPGTVTYYWSGDPAITGATGAGVNVVYTEPGIQSAGVRVTKGGQNLYQACSQSVEVI